MTAKRPWTPDVDASKLFGGGWALFEVERSSAHKRTFRLDDEKRGAFSEADARLFASASGLYEALEALLYDPYSMIRDSLRKKAEEAMLAANPAAFDPTPDVPASEPDGEAK